MPDDHPVLRMTLPEVQALVADLEAKACTWALPRRTPPPQVTLVDLAAIRASLRRSVAHLDGLLVGWDQARQR